MRPRLWALSSARTTSSPTGIPTLALLGRVSAPHVTCVQAQSPSSFAPCWVLAGQKTVFSDNTPPTPDSTPAEQKKFFGRFFTNCRRSPHSAIIKGLLIVALDKYAKYYGVSCTGTGFEYWL